MTENDLEIHYDLVNLEKLNNHFKKLVRCSNGQSHVSSHITEYDKYSERHNKVAALFIGRNFAKHSKLTGSVAQNLKCESSNSKGDADMMVLSDFPTINSKNKDFSLAPGNEIGFCKIRSNKRWGKYPCIREGDANYLSARSLRQLDLVWWPKEIQPTMFILDFIGKRTKIFNSFEQPENGAAINISWSSSYSAIGTFDSPGIRFYSIIISSYRANIMPMLEQSLQVQVEEFFASFMNLMRVIVHYIESDLYLLSNDNLEQFPDDGIIGLIMKYCSMKLHTYKFKINEKELSWLESKCSDMVSFAEKEIQSLDIKEEIRHKKTGSIDIIPAINCDGFPREAQMWSKRVAGKVWPKKQVVEDILQAGFQLVPKASKAPNNTNVAATSFRYSFNDAENILCLNLTEMQREIFRLVKMFYYEKLQRDPKILETYHLKTMLFWFIEENQQEIWFEDNLALCCLAFMDKLALALRQHHLSHYFIPEINLFQYLDKIALNELALVVESILKDPIANTGHIMLSVTDFYNKKINQESMKYDQFEMEKFFAKADKFFHHATSDNLKEEISRSQSEGTEIFEAGEDKMKPETGANKGMPETESGTRMSLNTGISKSGQNTRITMANVYSDGDNEANNKKLHCVLRFLSDLMFARKMEERQRVRNLTLAPKRNLRVAPLFLFVLTFLPIVNKVIKKTSSPVLGTSQSKAFKKILFFKMIINSLSYLFKTKCIVPILYFVTKLNNILKMLPIHGFDRKFFRVRKKQDISYGPSSQFISLISIFIFIMFILICFFLCNIFARLLGNVSSV